VTIGDKRDITGVKVDPAGGEGGMFLPYPIEHQLAHWQHLQILEVAVRRQVIDIPARSRFLFFVFLFFDDINYIESSLT
jgi:hypothetical protein